MTMWQWTKTLAAPDDMIDGARAIKGPGGRFGVRLVWTGTYTYLEWAQVALTRGGEDGWDSAVGLAKRAVYRWIDCIRMHNHLQIFLGKNCSDKARYQSGNASLGSAV
jgi:hypothetical protein